MADRQSVHLRLHPQRIANQGLAIPSIRQYSVRLIHFLYFRIYVLVKLRINERCIVMNIVKKYALSGGGVVAIMHDVNLTSMFADRVVILHRGKLFCDCAPNDVMTDDWLFDAYEGDLRVNKKPKPPAACIIPHLANTRKRKLD